MNCHGNCNQGRNCTCDPVGDRILSAARIIIAVGFVLTFAVILMGVPA